MMLSSVKPGMVVWGIHLHKDTVRVVDKHEHKAGHNWYEVEGKRRPVLVVSRRTKERGRIWFTVLPITSKGQDEKGHTKPGYLGIGETIEESIQSYVKLVTEDIPDNLISDDGRTCDVVKDLDPLTFSCIHKIHSKRAMGSS